MKKRRAVMRNAVRFRRLTDMRALVRMLKREQKWHSATVESAVALDASERDGVQRAIERRCGAPMPTTFTVNASVIAGVRIRAAGQLYDDTVRARLLAMETT